MKASFFCRTLKSWPFTYNAHILRQLKKEGIFMYQPERPDRLLKTVQPKKLIDEPFTDADNPNLHDVKKLLRIYRDVISQAEEIVQETDENFDRAYGKTMGDWIDLCQDAGVDVPDGYGRITLDVGRINSIVNFEHVLANAIAVMSEGRTDESEYATILSVHYIDQATSNMTRKERRIEASRRIGREVNYKEYATLLRSAKEYLRLLIWPEYMAESASSVTQAMLRAYRSLICLTERNRQWIGSTDMLSGSELQDWLALCHTAGIRIPKDILFMRSYGRRIDLIEKCLHIINDAVSAMMAGDTHHFECATVLAVNYIDPVSKNMPAKGRYSEASRRIGHDVNKQEYHKLLRNAAQMITDMVQSSLVDTFATMELQKISIG